MFNLNLDRVFRKRVQAEDVPTPELRESLKSFSSVEIPTELIGKKYKEAQKALKAQYGNRLATKKDLKHIQKNPDQYPHLQDPKVWHFAFGSIVRLDGSVFVPYLHWGELDRRFVSNEAWVVPGADGGDRVLLRD